MKYLTFLAAVFFLFMGGCGNDGTSHHPSKVKRIDLGAATPKPILGAAAPLPIIGWSTTLGNLVQQQCFDYDLVNGGDFQTHTNFGAAKTSIQESQNFGVDASVSLKLNMFSGSDTFHYVKNSDENALSVAMWFNADSGGTLKIINIKLNDTGKDAAGKGGSYFGLTCGDKVITSFPVLLSTRFNINFRSSIYSDATSISDSVKAGVSFASVSTQISNAFKKSNSRAAIEIQYVTAGNPDLFLSSYLSKADETSCYNTGDCSNFAADLINQFSNAAQNAGQQLSDDITKFNSIYFINYPQLLSTTNNFLPATSIAGVPPATSDPYGVYKDAISNAVDVYADLLVAADAMTYIIANSPGIDSQAITALNYYNTTLTNYAKGLYSQIYACFGNPANCSIPQDTSIFNFIANDSKLDADTKAALKSTVQALIYDIYTAVTGNPYADVHNLNWYFPQKLVYFKSWLDPSAINKYKNAAVTLNTNGAVSQNGWPIISGLFVPTELIFDKNTLSGTTLTGKSYQYYINKADPETPYALPTTSAGRINGTESFQFLVSPPQNISIALNRPPTLNTTLNFIPRLDYLPTINPFFDN